jgi:diaminohydroxyphosphoribosylaminopyrimidine deaminase / 5-amino-6-(5-phosphoribosylamino)uracil reductase
MTELEPWLLQQINNPASSSRPVVTLSWAQSLDGSIALNKNEPISISCDESRTLTHWMRSVHDVILVGIGTIISDNPQLDVRLVDGKNPQPVILDTHLRIPDDAHLLKRSTGFPWIVVGISIDYQRCLQLEKRGVMVLELGEDETGRIDLKALLSTLRRMGIRSVMVEGGAQVLTSFLRENLADQAVITTAPIWLGGYQLLSENIAKNDKQDKRLIVPSLIDMKTESFGPDLITWGRIGEKIYET